MQNQAEVNFSKWHFNNSQFSKVDLCQKSNSKVKSEITKVEFLPKSNFKRQISNVKFQVEFPTSNFQRSETFQIQLSFKFSKSNFEGQLEVIRACFSKSTTLWKSNNSNSNAWKVQFWQAHFKSQHFPSQVKYSFRFDREQTKKKKFDSKIGLQFAFFLSRENLVHQRAKNWLSINSDVRKIADSPLPASSRRQSRATYDWLRWRSQHGPWFEETSKNWEECGELRCGFRSTLIEAYHVPPYRLTLWFRTRSKQRRRLEEEKEKKNHMVPNSR